MSRNALASEAGMSLIEVMIALVLLSTVLVALGGLMFQAGRHTQRAAVAGYRSAASASAAAWVQSLPFGSLDGIFGCVTDTIGQLPYDRCTTVQTVGARGRKVTVVISPHGPLPMQPETLVVQRSSTSTSAFRTQ